MSELGKKNKAKKQFCIIISCIQPDHCIQTQQKNPKKVTQPICLKFYKLMTWTE